MVEQGSITYTVTVRDKTAPEHFSHSKCLHSLNFDNCFWRQITEMAIRHIFCNSYFWAKNKQTKKSSFPTITLTIPCSLHIYPQNLGNRLTRLYSNMFEKMRCRNDNQLSVKVHVFSTFPIHKNIFLQIYGLAIRVI